VFAYAGTDESSAKVYDGSFTALAKEPWMLISNDPKLQKETEPTQAPSTTPTELTTAAPTVAPTTAPTTLPTTVPTESPTGATTETLTEVPGAENTLSRLLPWLAVASAVGLTGIVTTLLVFRRKK
jgi:hypothetical protein